MMLTSFLYACLIITGGTAIVVAQEVTGDLPIPYYEGYYTYLYGTSILFILIFSCFLLRDWYCCSDKEEKQSGNQSKKAAGKGKAKSQSASTSDSGGIIRRTPQNPATREKYPQKMKDILTRKGCCENNSAQDFGVSKPARVQPHTGVLETSFDSEELESGQFDVESPKRKTTNNGHHHGSFFMRVGTIGFGLGTMIYCGLQCGKVMEPFFTKYQCYHILQSVNPVLQMIFTFTLMYFIFMNTRVNIHRYKCIARFGLMHIAATNICIWIRVVIYECMKQLNRYYKMQIFAFNVTESATKSDNFVKKMVDDFNRAAGDTYRKQRESAIQIVTPLSAEVTNSTTIARTVANIFRSVAASLEPASPTATTPFSIAKGPVNSTRFAFDQPTSVFMDRTTHSPATLPFSDTEGFTTWSILPSTLRSFYDATTSATNIPRTVFQLFNGTAIEDDMTNSYVARMDANKLKLESPYAFNILNSTNMNETCFGNTILDKLVEDSSPFLHPLVIQFSLVGAAAIFIIWRHIGRHTRYVSEENIERKLESMLSQRAVALAQAQHGTRMDCEGSSKGLFFGLLILVGSIICLILYFVLILHSQLKSMAIYLADVSHTAVMALSILAIFIGFIRAKNLKFYPTDTSDLNDLLLVFSAIGMFVYSLFSIIAGASFATDYEKHFFVMVTGIVTIIQVILQFLYISDMSKRHVYTPEHDRSKPGRQVVTFLIICNLTMWMLFTFESRKVTANPVQLDFYGFVAWTVLEHITLPLCMFHRFYSAIALAEIWKNSYKQCIE